MTLYVLFFNMNDVCFANIHPPFQKRTQQAIIISEMDKPSLVVYPFFYMIVDFLNSIFSVFTEPDILPLTKSLISSPIVEVK